MHDPYHSPAQKCGLEAPALRRAFTNLYVMLHFRIKIAAIEALGALGIWAERPAHYIISKNQEQWRSIPNVKCGLCCHEI